MPGRLALFSVLAAAVLGAKTSTPHFKWGQSKEQLYISVMVRDLDTSSVSVSVTNEGDFRFSSKTGSGEENILQFELREDVKQESLKWEIAARPDKWGTATLITLSKLHAHRWDVLVMDQKKFKGLIDKDWTREDQNLENEEEITVFDDDDNILNLNEKNFDQAVAKQGPLVVAARFPWCSLCKSPDQYFLKASSTAKARGKKKSGAAWKKVVFAYTDVRNNKQLGRRLATKCDSNCEYHVFSGSPREEPVKFKSKYEEKAILEDIEKFLRPAVEILKTPVDALKFKEKNLTVIGSFASEDSKDYKLYKNVANRMRGEMVFTAAFADQRDEIELWSPGIPHPFTLKLSEATAASLEEWLSQRSMPILQEYDWSLRDKLEKVKLPIARFWYDDKSNDTEFTTKVEKAVTDVASKLLGKLIFVKQKGSMYSYELRDYGLNHPEEYPALGIASNASYQSVKFGFRVAPTSSPVVPSEAKTAKDLWSDQEKSKQMFLDFCERVLAGTVEPSHESGAVHRNWTKGTVKNVVWNSFKEDVETPETNVLLEISGKYRMDNDKKHTEVDNLATALVHFAESITVKRLDTSENWLPSTFTRQKFSSDTEWYWIPAKGGVPKKLTKPKKDASMKKVIQFLKAEAGDKFEVADIMEKWESAMKDNPPKTKEMKLPEGADEMLQGMDADTSLPDVKDTVGDDAGAPAADIEL